MGSGGPEGPNRWQKATSPPQELEVGAHRAPYLLVDHTAPDASQKKGQVASISKDEMF